MLTIFERKRNSLSVIQVTESTKKVSENWGGFKVLNGKMFVPKEAKPFFIQLLEREGEKVSIINQL